MSASNSEQEFREKMIEQVSLISGRLSAIDEYNRSQDKLVDTKLEVITSDIDGLKTDVRETRDNMKRHAGAIGLMAFLVPLLFVGVEIYSNIQDNRESIPVAAVVAPYEASYGV